MNSIPDKLANVGDATRRLNPHLFPASTGASKSWEDSKPKLVRQRHAPAMNKTEQAFFDHMRHMVPRKSHVRAQEVTFVLANGVRYTPDVVISGLTWSAYDVKGHGGHVEDDAAVKIKMAAAKYPEITWYLAWPKDRTLTAWNTQQILP